VEITPASLAKVARDVVGSEHWDLCGMEREMKSHILIVSILISSCAPAQQIANEAEERLNLTAYMNSPEALRSMHTEYAARIVPRSGPVSELPRSEERLEVAYEWNGDRYQLDDFAAHTNTTGLLVIKNGRILHEAYFLGATEDSLFASWSMAKSFTSTLVGIAIDDGLIESVDDLITQYLPELKGTGYEGVSIKDVLQMSTGVAFTEDYEDAESDFARLWRTAVDHKERANDVASSFPRNREAGTEYYYSSNDTQILGWLLTRVTQKPLSVYLSEKIWKPLGMEKDAYWVLDREGEEGMEMAWCCLSSTLRDYARFGMLMANSGRWKQRQIVPAEWVREATIPDRPQVQYGAIEPGSRWGYQYQWWTLPAPDRAFVAIGVYGQFLLVNPAAGLVIVTTSAWPISWDDAKDGEISALFEALTEVLR